MPSPQVNAEAGPSQDDRCPVALPMSPEAAAEVVLVGCITVIHLMYGLKGLNLFFCIFVGEEMVLCLSQNCGGVVSRGGKTSSGHP